MCATYHLIYFNCTHAYLSVTNLYNLIAAWKSKISFIIINYNLYLSLIRTQHGQRFSDVLWLNLLFELCLKNIYFRLWQIVSQKKVMSRFPAFREDRALPMLSFIGALSGRLRKLLHILYAFTGMYDYTMENSLWNWSIRRRRGREIIAKTQKLFESFLNPLVRLWSWNGVHVVELSLFYEQFSSYRLFIFNILYNIYVHTEYFFIIFI